MEMVRYKLSITTKRSRKLVFIFNGLLISDGTCFRFDIDQQIKKKKKTIVVVVLYLYVAASADNIITNNVWAERRGDSERKLDINLIQKLRSVDDNLTECARIFTAC